MPIIKCPKCGEEYDSMYSSHSCKKPGDEERRPAKDIALGNFFKISFLIFALVAIVLFLYSVLFILTKSIIDNIEIGFFGGLFISLFIILPLYLFREKLPLIRLKVSLPKIKRFTRKNILFLLPLLFFIFYFLFPIFTATPKTLSQTKSKQCFFENCIPNKWVKEKLSYSEAVSFCKKECNYQNYYYYYGDKKIERTPIGKLFFKNLIDNSSTPYQKIFHFQNIIIMFLGLILYYGTIFGITIIKRLEKQK